MDPEKILSVTDCETERTPAELVQWVQEKNDLFRGTKEGRNYLVSRQGLAKKFIDEIYVLSLLVRHLFDSRRDVVCKPNLGDDDSNAVVVDYRKRPLRVRNIVFAHAIFRYEDYLRRLYLPEEEPLFTLSWLMGGERTETKGKARNEDDTLFHVILLNKGLDLVAKAARQKANEPYGKLTDLVIVFDDYGTFRSKEDLSTLEEFVISDVLSMDLDFGNLFLLGWSGNTILEFAVIDHAKSKPQQE